MNANRVAQLLQEAGFTVPAVSQPDALEDGMVCVGRGVHVQVPYLGKGLCVVHETSEGATTQYPTRESIAALVADLRNALSQ